MKEFNKNLLLKVMLFTQCFACSSYNVIQLFHIVFIVVCEFKCIIYITCLIFLCLCILILVMTIYFRNHLDHGLWEELDKLNLSI